MNLEIFNFNETEKIRVFVDENKKIWFNANDIFKILGINSKGGRSDALADLDDDELGSFKKNLDTQVREHRFVSESGLYALILRSRKPIAKPFQKWVTKKVLPSIRKTGKYELENSKPIQTPQQDFDLDSYISENEKLIKLVKLITSENTITLHYLDKLTKQLNLKSPLELLQIDLN